MTRDEALAAMILSVQFGEPRHFYVGLVGYFIEGTPVSATGLSVDALATSNLRPTDGGFACEALFPTHLLSSEIVAGKSRVSRMMPGGDVVTDLIAVQLEVKLKDVWAVAEFVDGMQRNLYQNTETVAASQLEFLRLSQAWAVTPEDRSTH